MNHDPYAEMRWCPREGEGLVFDDQYRAAHLPHVAPDHPRSLARWGGRDYHNGRYERARVSLVADLGRRFLDQPACRVLLQRLSNSSFAGKVDFDLINTRAPNLHCTLVGDVHPGLDLRTRANQELRGAQIFTPILHGPFIGRFNRGRIYFPLEFDVVADQRVLDRVNAVFKRDRPHFAAVGLVNLRDELDPPEAHQLVDMLADLQLPRARLPISNLSWTSTHDDLTLEMRRLETIALAAKETTWQAPSAPPRLFR